MSQRGAPILFGVQGQMQADAGAELDLGSCPSIPRPAMTHLCPTMDGVPQPVPPPIEPGGQGEGHTSGDTSIMKSHRLH